MTVDKSDHTIKPKLGLLRLADRLGSVTKACETLGYSRDSYYRFKGAGAGRSRRLDPDRAARARAQFRP